MSYIFGEDYGGDGSGSSTASGVNCQDCGNQAKKDCQHKRCRTCCRSRGLPCETHINSTWVPVAKRRQRHSLSPQQQQENSGNQQLSLMTTTGGGTADVITEHNYQNRFREYQHRHHTRGGSGISATHLHNISTSSGFYFPAEASFPATFRRVTLSGTNEQVAYQTAVSIGGHVFNGILYDHGPADHQGTYYDHPVGGGFSSAAVADQYQDVNLITTSSGTTDTASSSSMYPAGDPSSMYATPISAFLAGTQFFPPPRS